MPPIALSTPQVTTVTNLAVTSLTMIFGATDQQTVVQLTYAPCDANGNVVPGIGQSTRVTLSAADEQAFLQTAGSVRVKAEAALQSNLAAASGTAT